MKLKQLQEEHHQSSRSAKKNYEHYEISSYAYRGENGQSHRSKHNQIYWQYTGHWYAIGLGSTSNINGVRWARPRAMSDYISWTDNSQQNKNVRVTTLPISIL